EEEIRGLITTLDHLSIDPDKRWIRRLLIEVAEIHVGEKGGSASSPAVLADLLRRCRALTFPSPLVKKAQASVMVAEDRLTAEEHGDLMRKKMQLEDLLRGARSTWIKDRRGGRGWIRTGEPVLLDGKAPDRMRRSFQMAGELTKRWYWLDPDELP